MTDEWKKQENDPCWLPEAEGEELVGEVTEIDAEATYGRQLTIKKENGELIRTPSHKALISRLMKVNLGDMVKIIFKGMEPPSVKGYQPMRVYEVFVKAK